MAFPVLRFALAIGAIAANHGAFAQTTFTTTAVAQHSGLCLEVPGASTQDVQLTQNTCNGRPEQSFRLEPVAGLSQVFLLRAPHSDKCLRPQVNSQNDGVPAIQTGCEPTNTLFQYRLEGLSRGSTRFRIRNVFTSRCVEVSGNSTALNRPVQFWTCQGLTAGLNQNWTLAGAASAGFGAGQPITPARADASRFLQQASFGATAAEIDRVVSLGYAGWINDQFSRTASSHFQMNQAIHNELSPFLTTQDDKDCKFSYPCQLARHDTWWEIGVRGQDQLRQRVAFALSQFFVISDVSDNVGYSQQAVSDYYDTLVVNGLGNYRTLLEEVALNPLMGRYLGMLQNEKADPRNNTEPDENFAREVMQLFSIGLIELNIDGTPRLDAQGNTIPTYDNTRITNLARALTGWNFGTTSNWYVWEDNVKLPGLIVNMAPVESFHDTAAKTLLNGVNVPAGGTSRADLQIALDNLANHPNVGPFLARHLIQRMVTSNPSPAYIARVATVFNNNGSGVRGDMRAVVRAILLDTEARDASVAQQYGSGKVKEPMLRFAAVLRAFGAQGQTVSGAAGPTTRALLRNRGVGVDMSQSVMSSPSVFNFYRPNFLPTGDLRQRGLFAPELQILNEASSITTLNHLYSRLNRTDRDDTGIALTTTDPRFYITQYRFDLSAEKPLAVSPEALVDRLNLLLMGGRMPTDMRTILINAAYEIPMNDGGGDRVEDMIFLIASSSQFAVQR